MQTKEQFEKQQELAKRDGFAAWMNEPMTRTLVSMIPPGENPELLRMILQAAFDNGFARGAGATAISFISSLMGPESRR
jgi:hypothetical protein